MAATQTRAMGAADGRVIVLDTKARSPISLGLIAACPMLLDPSQFYNRVLPTSLGRIESQLSLR